MNPDEDRKIAVDKLAQGCGGCIATVLRVVTFAFVVAEFVKHCQPIPQGAFKRVPCGPPDSRHRRFRPLKRTLALLAAAEGADVLTTWYGLAHGAHEGNPTSAVVIAAAGLSTWAALKFYPVVLTGLFGFFMEPWPRHRELFLKGIRVGSLMLFGVVASNVLMVVR
jgi:hypothetical protein